MHTFCIGSEQQRAKQTAIKAHRRIFACFAVPFKPRRHAAPPISYKQRHAQQLQARSKGNVSASGTEAAKGSKSKHHKRSRMKQQRQAKTDQEASKQP